MWLIPKREHQFVDFVICGYRKEHCPSLEVLSSVLQGEGIEGVIIPLWTCTDLDDIDKVTTSRFTVEAHLRKSVIVGPCGKT